jgi:hypothetical protein
MFMGMNNNTAEEDAMAPKSNWGSEELKADAGWIYQLDAKAGAALLDAVRAAPKQDDLLDYQKSDFDLGPAGAVLQEALEQAKRGRGVALIRGLPRANVTEQEFRLMSWALGLHSGVARPQGAKTQYLSEVRDVGTVYRTGKGRGYSSNAQLDYHTDSADLVFLTCYNRAVEGGLSITTSTPRAHDEMERQHPDHVHWLHQPIHFSRQGEQAPDEGPTCEQPVYVDTPDGLVCRWNWNRMNSAQQIEGVPKLEPEHMEALKRFDAVVRQPALSHHFWLMPGDLQIINSHRTLHSRTEFRDHEDPALKRLMYRLWIAPPDSQELPGWYKPLFRHTEAGSVRGGIRGFEYDQRRQDFERRQAAATGVKFLS